MSTERISKNAIANIMGMFTQIIIAFLLSPFLVHTLGDTKYGIWTIAVAFTGYMNLLDFGLTSAVNRYVSKYSSLKDPNRLNAIVSTSLALFVFMGSIIVLISPWMADLIVSLVNLDEKLKPVVHLLIIIVSFDIAIFVIGGLFKGIFSGFQNYTVINIVLIISSVYKAVMFYYFLTVGHDLIAMGLISITANVLTMIIFYFLMKRSYPDVKFELKFVNKPSAKKILSYSKFTFIAMVANQIIYYSDAFVIGYFLTAAAVTYYSIPWTLAEYTKNISLAISQTYTPAISEQEAAGNLDSVRSLYLSGTKYMIVISNLLSIGMMLLGGAFISIWMGPKYRELGELVLIILFVNQFFQGPQQISYSLLQGLSRQKYYSYVSMAVSVVNLILSIILVQKYGIVGVAIGAAVPQILFYGIFVPWLTLRTLDMPVWFYLRHTHLLGLIPTAVLFVCLYMLADFHLPTGYVELFAEAIVCTIAYLVCAFFIMFNVSERKAIVQPVANRLGLNN